MHRALENAGEQCRSTSEWRAPLGITRGGGAGCSMLPELSKQFRCSGMGLQRLAEHEPSVRLPCLLQGELAKAGEAVPEYLRVALPPGGPGGALGAALERSRQLCLMRYETERFGEAAYLDLYRRTRDLQLNPEQLAVFAGAPPKHATVASHRTRYTLSAAVRHALQTGRLTI